MPAESVAIEIVARLNRAEADIKRLDTTYSTSTNRMKKATADLDAAISRVDASSAASFDRIGRNSQKAANDIEQGSRRAAAAQRNVARQVSDVSSQLASGTPPLLIFAQQSGQVADALADTGGKAAKVAAFFAGPWGAALLGAVSIAALFASSMRDGASAAEDKADAADDLKQALDRVTAAEGAANASTRIGIALNYAAATALRARAVQARAAARDELLLARSRLEGGRAQVLGKGASLAPEEQIGALGAAAGYERQVARLDAQIAELDKKVREGTQKVGSARAEQSLRRVAAATDAATAATQRYEDRTDSLRRQLERGQISQARFEREVTTATRSRDAELKALEATDGAARRRNATSREETKAARERATAIREAAQAQRELEQTLSSLISRFDPLQAQALNFDEAMRDIERVRLGGLISDADAMGLRLAAAVDNANKLRELGGRNGFKFDEPLFAGRDRFGKPTGTPEQIAAALDDDGRKEMEKVNRVIERRKQGERELAGLFESLFTDGADRVAERYKQQLLAVAAQFIARILVASFDGDSRTSAGSVIGSIGSIIGSAFGGGGTPGFATGGSMVIGGRGGVDQNLLSLNGRPLARVSKGETLNFQPAAAIRPSQGVTVIQNFTLDNRGGITTPELIAGINRTIDQKAAQAGTAAYRQSMRDAPAAMQHVRRYGTPRG